MVRLMNYQLNEICFKQHTLPPPLYIYVCLYVCSVYKIKYIKIEVDYIGLICCKDKI